MNIVRSRGLLRKGTRWIVRNGHSIRFWEDKWMGGKLLVFRKLKRLMEFIKTGPCQYKENISNKLVL